MVLEPETQMVIDKFNVAQQFRRPLETNWNAYYKQYRGITVQKYWSDTGVKRSSLHIPATFKAVETLLPRIMNTLFAVNPPFDVRPREESDKRQSEIIKELIRYQFDQSNVYSKFADFVKQALIYGTSIAKVIWRKDEGEGVGLASIYEEAINPVTGLLERNEVGQEMARVPKILFDNPDFEVVDLFDFFIDPDATEIGQSWEIHRTIKTFDELKALERQGIYENIDKLKETQTSEKDSKSERRGAIGLSEPQDIKGITKIEILEYWGDWKDKDSVITIANRSVSIRPKDKQRNPYYHSKHPFIHIICFPIPKEFYGMGICEVINSMQEELDDTRNQRLDNVTLILNRMWTYNKDSGINPHRLKSAPGRLIPRGADPEDITPLITPDVTESAYMEEKLIKDDIEEATGATRSIMPSADVKSVHRTAAGLAMMQSAAGERLKLIIGLIEEQGMKKLIEMYYQLDLQFIDKEMVIRIVGEEGNEFIKVSPEDIRGNFDFKPAGSSEVVNKEIELNQLTAFLNMAAPVLGPAVYKLLRKIWERFGFKNAEEIIPEPQEPQEVPEGSPEEEEQVMGLLKEQGMGEEELVRAREMYRKRKGNV